MCVVCAILIVDHNTARTDNLQEHLSEGVTLNANELPESGSADRQPRILLLPIRKIEIIKQHSQEEQATTLLRSSLPTQQLHGPLLADIG